MGLEVGQRHCVEEGRPVGGFLTRHEHLLTGGCCSETVGRLDDVVFFLEDRVPVPVRTLFHSSLYYHPIMIVCMA